MPLIDMTPSDPDTIMTALHQAQQITSDRGQDYVLFTADLQLYRVAVNILWACPDQFDNVGLTGGTVNDMHGLKSSLSDISS